MIKAACLPGDRYLSAWLSVGQKIFLETAREAYEAYVIYNFYMLMLNYLGGGQAVRDILSEQVGDAKPRCSIAAQATM